MYERFTDRARKVMRLSEKEAMRFNHEYIGTEHVLLGLIKEGSGVAANVLKNLDIDLRKLRKEIEKIIRPGPDMVTMGKLPQTPRVKEAIEYAIEEARNLNHNYVGTEHLLLGLLREEEGVASQVLMNLGLKLSDVREEVLNLLGHNTATEEKTHLHTVYLARPLNPWGLFRELATKENGDGPTGNNASLVEEHERIRSLERQLWNVRIVLGALTGALAGSLFTAALGAVLGSIIGGVVAALGWRIPAALAGGVTGALLGSAHLPSEGGGLGGALLGALAGVLIAEIGAPSDRRGFSKLWWRK